MIERKHIALPCIDSIGGGDNIYDAFKRIMIIYDGGAGQNAFVLLAEEEHKNGG